MACGLGYPDGGEVGRHVGYANAVDDVLDGCQGVRALSGWGGDFEEVAGQDGASPDPSGPLPRLRLAKSRLLSN